MKKISSGKLFKFESKIRKIVGLLNDHNELAIHQAIDHSYYMQKIEELKILNEGLLQAEARLENVHLLICSHYSDVYVHWRRDVRWLQAHLLKKEQGFQ